MAEQPESRLQRKIVKALNELPACYFQKIHGTPYGKPTLDLLGVINGRMCWIEVKMPGNKPTARQYNIMHQWRMMGTVTGWATSVDEALEIVKPYLESVCQS